MFLFRLVSFLVGDIDLNERYRNEKLSVDQSPLAIGNKPLSFIHRNFRDTLSDEKFLSGAVDISCKNTFKLIKC